MDPYSSENKNNVLEGRRVIALVGPTGVGKTETALFLANAFDGEIVSCDSVQIYKELNIGSAKPSFEERSRVTHHIIDIFEPDFQTDTGIYKSLAEEAILDILKRNKLPFITGGTGLYFNSLYNGLFEAPSRDDDIRFNLEKRIATEGLQSLYLELIQKDPASAAKIMPGDKRRIIRALEVYIKRGKPSSNLQLYNKKLDLKWFIIGLNIERKKLYERIENRINRMISGGLVEETKSIMERYGRNAYALGSIGYRHAKNFIDGVWNEEEFLYNLKLDTRHYAKRQITWFKKNRDIHWFDPEKPREISDAVKTFLKS